MCGGGGGGGGGWVCASWDISRKSGVFSACGVPDSFRTGVRRWMVREEGGEDCV